MFEKAREQMFLLKLPQRVVEERRLASSIMASLSRLGDDYSPATRATLGKRRREDAVMQNPDAIMTSRDLLRTYRPRLSLPDFQKFTHFVPFVHY